MKNPIKWALSKVKKPDLVKEALEADLAQKLMEYGFKPEESFKLSRDFWNRNLKKLKDIMKY